MEEQSRTYILEASDLSVSFETDAGEVQAVRDVSLSLKCQNKIRKNSGKWNRYYRVQRA